MDQAVPEDIVNKTFAEIALGDSAETSKTLTAEDVALFATVSGDVNPAHLDPVYAATDLFGRVIGHGMWTAGLISAVLGTKLPGPGTIYLGQNLRFRRPVDIGDTITARITATEKREEKGIVVFDCHCSNQNGVEILSGTAEVLAPTAPVHRPKVALPDVVLVPHARLSKIVERALALPALPVAVIFPVEAASLLAARAAADAGLAVPVLVGPERQIRKAAEAAGLSLDGLRIEPTSSVETAVARGAEMARHGVVRAIAQGALPLPVLVAGLAEAEPLLGVAANASQITLIDVPTYHKLLALTDTGLHAAPDLSTKCLLCANAFELMRRLDVPAPVLAALAATSRIDPAQPATIEAAALAGMAARGQIAGGSLVGPLDFEEALRPRAGDGEGVDADILLAPSLESASLLLGQMVRLANADAASIVLGLRVPLLPVARNGGRRGALAAAALARIVANPGSAA